MKEKVFAEIGFGNKSFVSTEIETSNREYRVGRFIKPKKFEGVYLRIWLFKKVFIVSTLDGIKFKNKKKIKFKFLIGIEGIN